jgi:uncharacterized membrane protein
MAGQKQARASGRAKTADKPAQAGTAKSRTATGDGTRAQGGQAGTRAQSGQAGTRAQSTRARDGRARTGGTGQGGNGRGGSQGRGGGNGRGGSQGQGTRPRSAGTGQDGPSIAAQPRPGTRAVALAAAGSPPARSAPPFWFQILTLVLSLGGLGMSVYLTIAHYTSTSILACSNKGYIDCAKVTTSPESVVFGIFPVAVLGLAFYVFMVAITTPWAWRSPLPLIPWARTAAIITGIGFVLYLIYAEVVEINNICILCTTVHIITFVLFVLLMSVAPLRSKAGTGSPR